MLSGGSQGKCTKLAERPREPPDQAVRVESRSVPVVCVPEISKGSLLLEKSEQLCVTWGSLDHPSP